MKHRRPDIERFLPLKPVVLQILLALHGSDAHGYAVMRAVREESGNRVRLSNGAFYRHLGWLLERGLVAESDERPEDADPRRGAHYRLTALGEDVLAAEGVRMRGVLSALESKGVRSDERIA